MLKVKVSFLSDLLFVLLKYKAIHNSFVLVK